MRHQQAGHSSDISDEVGDRRNRNDQNPFDTVHAKPKIKIHERIRPYRKQPVRLVIVCSISAVWFLVFRASTFVLQASDLCEVQSVQNNSKQGVQGDCGTEQECLPRANHARQSQADAVQEAVPSISVAANDSRHLP
jgi:hypothetical protein